MSDDYYEFTLRLGRIKHLFQEPEFDLFVPVTDSASGIERLVNQLKPTSLACQVRTTIALPKDELAQNLETLVKNSLQGYCDSKIARIANDLDSLRGQGFRALNRGLLFLAACTMISTLFDTVEYLPILAHKFLNEGLLIAGWVSLWYPIELLLYQWSPLKRQKRIYELIRAMEVTITTHDDTP